MNAFCNWIVRIYKDYIRWNRHEKVFKVFSDKLSRKTGERIDIDLRDMIRSGKNQKDFVSFFDNICIAKSIEVKAKDRTIIDDTIQGRRKTGIKEIDEDGNPVVSWIYDNYSQQLESFDAQNTTICFTAAFFTVFQLFMNSAKALPTCIIATLSDLSINFLLAFLGLFAFITGVMIVAKDTKNADKVRLFNHRAIFVLIIGCTSFQLVQLISIYTAGNLGRILSPVISILLFVILTITTIQSVIAGRRADSAEYITEEVLARSALGYYLVAIAFLLSIMTECILNVITKCFGATTVIDTLKAWLFLFYWLAVFIIFFVNGKNRKLKKKYSELTSFVNMVNDFSTILSLLYPILSVAVVAICTALITLIKDPSPVLSAIGDLLSFGIGFVSTCLVINAAVKNHQRRDRHFITVDLK